MVRSKCTCTCVLSIVFSDQTAVGQNRCARIIYSILEFWWFCLTIPITDLHMYIDYSPRRS